MIEQLIPRQRPTLFPMTTNAESPTSSFDMVSPDSLEAPIPSQSSPATDTAPALPSLPPGSALQALLGKRMKPLPPTHLDIPPEMNPTVDEKKIVPPPSTTDLNHETAETQAPPPHPRSPVKPPPSVVEPILPPAPLKPATSNHSIDRHEYAV